MSGIEWGPLSFWLVIGLALLIIEMLTGTLFFLFVGIAAFLVALVVGLTDVGPVIQGVCFAVFSLLALVAWWKLRHWSSENLEQREGGQSVNNRFAAYVGRETVLEEPIVSGRGRVRLDDSYWSVEGADAPAGTRVRVTAVRGIVMQVESI